MNRTPVEIRRLGDNGLAIKWSDGTSHEISSAVLRQGCPCATCREAAGDSSHAKPLTGAPAPTKKPSLLKVIEHTLDEELRLVEVWAVGRYAIGIAWGDKHSSGIYS